MNAESWTWTQLAKPSDILSRYDVDKDGKLNYEEFRNLCVELFDVDEIEKHANLMSELFKLFDTNTDNMLDERELKR